MAVLLEGVSLVFENKVLEKKCPWRAGLSAPGITVRTHRRNGLQDRLF